MQTLTEDLCVTHRAITEYWYSKKNGSGLPSRRDVNPCDLRQFLGRLSIMEVREGDCIIRLSGSTAIRTFGLRQKARIRSDLRLVEGNWWVAAAERAIRSGEPQQGVRDVASGAHVWLRLPLLDTIGDNLIVLCHDYLAKTETPDYDPGYRNRSEEAFRSIAA